MGVSLAASILGLVLLLLPVGFSIFLIIASRRRGPDHASCGSCRYNVESLIGKVDRCPECGSLFATVGILPPTVGRRNSVMLYAGIACLIVSLACPIGLVTTTFVSAQRAAAARQQAISAQQQVNQASPPDATREASESDE